MSDIVGRCNSPSDISGDDHDFEHTDMILIFDEKYNKAECMKREDLSKLYQGVNIWQTEVKLVKLPYMGVWVVGYDKIPDNRTVFVLEKVIPDEKERERTRRSIVYENAGSPISPSQEREINTCLLIGSSFGVSSLHEAREIVRKIVPADTNLAWVRDIEERGRSRITSERKVEEVQPYVMTEEDRRRQREMNEIRERRVAGPWTIENRTLTVSESKLTVLPPFPEEVKIILVKDCDRLVEISSFPSTLRVLRIQNCERLPSLPEFPNTLEVLMINSCTSLVSLPNLPERLTYLSCEDCTALTQLPRLPETLENLNCAGCTSLIALPELPENLLFLDGRDSGIQLWGEIPAGIEECLGCPQ